MLYISIIPGILFGLGVALIFSALIPNRVRLSSAIHNLTSRESSQDKVLNPSIDQRIGGWLIPRIPEFPGFGIPHQDLKLIDRSEATFVFQKALYAAIGFVAPGILGLAFQLITGTPLLISGILGIPLAVVFWFVPDHEVKTSATRSRQEFRRAIAVYLELVATERKRGAHAAHALESAAEIGDTWVFARIRQELTRAKLAGTPPWDALQSFSNDVGVIELRDLAQIVKLSGESGASIYETLRSKGKSLRIDLLNKEHSKANQATEQMQVPITGITFVFISIVLTPMILSIV